MKKLFSSLLIFSLAGCGGGSSSDPETNDLGEFNPPSQLASLTRDASLELTWVGANAEDDFQGYHVFGTTTSLSDLQALVKYPKGASVLKSQSIPRCVDNNAFFKAFGFPDTTAKCESSVIPEEKSDGIFLNSGSMGYIIDEEEKNEATTEEDKLVIDFNIPCAGVGDESVSLTPAADGRTLGRAFCLVNQVYNGSKLEKIANGTTYTYLVVAVKGKDKNNISWISNVIEDTPAKKIFNAEVELAGGDDSSAQYVVFEINGEDPTAIEKPTPKTCSQEAGVCKLTNTATSATEGIVVGRESATGSFAFQQRLVVSSKAGGKLKLQQRGAQVFYDQLTKTYLPQLPGDQAVDNGSYADAGSKFTFYEHAVYDFQYDLGNGNYRYGKMAVTDLSYSDPKSKTSKVKLDVTIVIQPQLNQTHYLHSIH